MHIQNIQLIIHTYIRITDQLRNSHFHKHISESRLTNSHKRKSKSTDKQTNNIQYKQNVGNEMNFN